ncbi:MAG: haloalkane dehalogenase [Polymorphobacter sp.]
MRVLRTPDSAFEGLAEYPFAPRWSVVADARLGPLRMHYLDEGPDDGPSILLLHGEPSWSYLYRRMIPLLVGAGFRCLAPDLVGFGKSDKPAATSDYSYAWHVAWLSEWFEQMALRDVTLFCQDWGGLLGLRLVAAYPDRFARVMASNTFLPTGDSPISPGFLRWRDFSQSVSVLPVGGIIQGGTARGITAAVRAAYDAPFPDERYKAGARVFPTLVPTRPDDAESEANRIAWRVLEDWHKPFLTAFGDSDAVMAGADREFQARIPGARGQRHVTIAAAGHFSQEDAGAELAEVLLGLMTTA